MYRKIMRICCAAAFGVGSVVGVGFTEAASAAPSTCLRDSGNLACVDWSDNSLDYRAYVQDVNGDRLFPQLDIAFYGADGSMVGADAWLVNDWDAPLTVRWHRPASARKAVVTLCTGWQLSDYYPSCAEPVTVTF